MVDDPLRYFRIEARELVEQLTQGVLDLERARGDREAVARLLRAAHTLKGAARVVRQPDLADHAHELESLLVGHRRADDEPVPTTTVSRLLAISDDLSISVGQLPPAPDGAPTTAHEAAAPARRAGAPVEVAVAPGPPAGSVLPAVRADARDVDELLDVVGEAHAQLAPLRRQVESVERARRSAELLADRLRARALVGDEPGDRRTDAGHGTAGRLAGELTALARSLTDSVSYVQRELDEVRRRAERLRLAPASSIFGALRRAVRDAADVADKQVTFEASGGDLRIDPHVLTLIGNAMLHVVRNAVVHGIEPSADRVAAGKPPAGRVIVEALRRGRHGAFRCRDDGQGFDLAALRTAAAATGWRSATGDDARDLPELMRLLMRGGISTAREVSSAAGRGIGLDVLRDIAEQLGGEVRVSTDPGEGTTVEFVAPLTVVSMQGLVVRAGEVTATIPLDAVRTCLRLGPDQSAHAVAEGALAYGSSLAPFVPLTGLLGGGDGTVEVGNTVAVIVTADGESGAVGAHELLGISTLVSRPLPELAPADPVVDSVTLDADGAPRIVLAPAALIAGAARRAPRGARESPGAAAIRNPILVVDDSLTTRMLERSILEAAGYRVDVAASGEEGLAKAAETRYALFLVDIDMPGIDGFTFLERTRADPDLRDIPVIMVSSRDTAEDRRRGAEAGASGHVAKGEFDQDELLDRIRTLVGA
ncbi:hybrid sensor histidine kinase/response regulator [Pilimelia columellifera]|uniref:histidine kinase n=1 Tax=Pilimelia columellifera subsp. columellifera TaxID=706583 RepID=A0ABN3NLQ5_9ACTN